MKTKQLNNKSFTCHYETLFGVCKGCGVFTQEHFKCQKKATRLVVSLSSRFSGGEAQYYCTKHAKYSGGICVPFGEKRSANAIQMASQRLSLISDLMSRAQESVSSLAPRQRFAALKNMAAQFKRVLDEMERIAEDPFYKIRGKCYLLVRD